MAATIHQLHPERHAAEERERRRLATKMDVAGLLLEGERSSDALFALSIALTDEAEGALRTGAAARAVVLARRAQHLRDLGRWWSFAEALVCDAFDLERAEDLTANIQQGCCDLVLPSREELIDVTERSIACRNVRDRLGLTPARVSGLARRAVEAWAR